MLTVGVGDGAVSFLGGWRVEPFILVEGLFDGLSLAACGWPIVKRGPLSVARWVRDYVTASE